MAYTPNGAKWIKEKEMLAERKGNMWYVDRQSLPKLSLDNQVFWSRLLHAHHPSSVKELAI
jgi:hypothetical protein